MKLPQLTLRDLFCLVLACAMPFSATGEEREPEYASAFRIIGYSQANAKDLKPYAKQVSELVGAKLLLERERNPICCVWLELVGTPSPGKPGYVILHQGGGTVIQASNAEQMKLAIERWQSVSKKTLDGDLEFPVGLVTSHKVID
jgi:hypothetical protein